MNISKLPRASIILPTHNRPGLLREPLDSVCNQTCPDWKAVIVDDASIPAAAFYLEDASMRILRHETAQGWVAARNIGIQNVRGDTLAYLGDDCYEPCHLSCRAAANLTHHFENVGDHHVVQDYDQIAVEVHR